MILFNYYHFIYPTNYISNGKSDNMGIHEDETVLVNTSNFILTDCSYLLGKGVFNLISDVAYNTFEELPNEIQNYINVYRIK